MKSPGDIELGREPEEARGQGMGVESGRGRSWFGQGRAGLEI